MDAREAVAKAKEHVAALFSDERIQDLGLEEIEYDDTRKRWYITLGFTRPWDTVVARTMTALSLSSQAMRVPRTYKVVTIGDDGCPLSVRNRESADAG
jgi:hypothetical protein